jgi:alpha-1,6-mannosyltransferase
VKILHLTNFYHNRSGGIKTYLDAKNDFLKSKGLPVLHVIPGERDVCTHPQPGVTVYEVASPPAPVNSDYRVIWNLATVTTIIMQEKPDIVEINDKYTLPYAAVFARLLGTAARTVGFVHERLDDTLNLYWKPPWLAALTAKTTMRIIAACYDHIVCASHFVAEEFKSYASKKTSVIPLGVDTETFHPENFDGELRQSLCDEDEALLLFAGRFAKEKNIRMLPEIMSELRDRGVKAKLLLVGKGPERQPLEDIPGSEKIELGFVADRTRLARLKAISDVLIFPSLREPFGLAPLEALASGCPVVCVNSGGPTEYSGCAAVRTVEPKADEFAAQIENLLLDDREKLRKTARKHAMSFSWEATFSKQLTLYSGLI